MVSIFRWVLNCPSRFQHFGHRLKKWSTKSFLFWFRPRRRKWAKGVREGMWFLQASILRHHIRLFKFQIHCYLIINALWNDYILLLLFPSQCFISIIWSVIGAYAQGYWFTILKSLIHYSLILDQNFRSKFILVKFGGKLEWNFCFS